MDGSRGSARHGVALDWVALAERSAFPFERLDRGCFVAADAGSPSAAEERLARWDQNLRVAGLPGLEKRLAWDGLTRDDGRRAVGPVRLAAGVALPPWVDTLRAIVDHACAGMAGEPAGPSGQDDDPPPIPFAQLLAPPVAVARAMLERRLARHAAMSADVRRELLDDRTLLDLERDLTRRLAHLCGRSFLARFDAVRPYGTRMAARLADASAVLPREFYERFVAQELSSGLATLFADLPVLARLIAATVEDWVHGATELIERLGADLPALTEAFAGPDGLLGPAVGADSLRSDPHDGGRTVVLLRFASGLRLVYKPRPVSIARGFDELIQWCAARGAEGLPPAMRVVDREHYGWAEYVEHGECATDDEARRYFERAGSLLSFLYFLDATDCHHENLVATGEGLVLIDAETLLHADVGQFADSGDLGGDGLVQEKMNRSVLRSGLLPRWDASRDSGVAQDISGLGGGSTTSTVVAPKWRHVNTDGMALVDERVALPREANVARRRGDVLHAATFRQEIVGGFERTYRFLAAHRDAITAGPLAAMAHLPNRFVFRGTKIYVGLLNEVLRPGYLADGADFWLGLERLGKAFVVSDERPPVWPLFRAELDAMARGNVPLFRTLTSSTTIWVEGDLNLPAALVASSLDRVRGKLAGLDEADLAFQAELIHGALMAAHAEVAERSERDVAPVAEAMLSVDACLEAAAEVADDLLRRAIGDPDSGLSWLGLSYDPLGNRYQMELAGDRLYDGRAGIGLFLAAAYELTGEGRFRRGAYGSVARLRRGLEDLDEAGWRRALNFDSLGAALGLSSAIYGLLRIGRSLRDSGFGDLARRFVQRLPLETPSASGEHDVLSGRAGLILVLLCAHQELGDPDALAKACQAGEQLLAARDSVAGAPRAWARPGMPQLAGFSHGAAGITLALARLFAATGDERFRDAALEGMAFERTLYSPAERNWRDLRPDFQAGSPDGKPLPSAVQWCNGAPGVALARLGVRQCLEAGGVMADIEVGLETTDAHGVGGPDHLCCGTMGRVETLLAGSRLPGGGRYRERALRYAAWVVARARASGGYRIFANAPAGVACPGFFVGTAGIGYQLLRLAHPELPSVLAFE